MCVVISGQQLYQIILLDFRRDKSSFTIKTSFRATNLNSFITFPGEKMADTEFNYIERMINNVFAFSCVTRTTCDGICDKYNQKTSTFLHQIIRSNASKIRTEQLRLSFLCLLIYITPISTVF